MLEIRPSTVVNLPPRVPGASARSSSGIIQEALSDYSITWLTFITNVFYIAICVIYVFYILKMYSIYQ